CVVDRIGAVIARGYAGTELDHAEHGAARQRRTNLARAIVLLAVIVDWKFFRRPDGCRQGAGPARFDVGHGLVDLDDRLSGVVVAGDDAPNLECHVCPPLCVRSRLAGTLARMVTSLL